MHDSKSDPTTLGPNWLPSDRFIRLIEPWKRSISQSAEQLPKATQNVPVRDEAPVAPQGWVNGKLL